MLDPKIEDYLTRLHAGADRVQAEMEAEGLRRGFPIIGPLVGRLAWQWARAVQARTVFEMGSGFGYSTLHFARAVGPGGRVIHTDGDRELSAEAHAWLERAGLGDRVEFRVGDAIDLLKRDKTVYDVVFIDVDKHQYPAAWTIAREHVGPGGLIVTDNTLWQGKVVTPARDAATRGVKQYNTMAFNDPAFTSTLVPIRDGVTVSLRTD